MIAVYLWLCRPLFALSSFRVSIQPQPAKQSSGLTSRQTIVQAEGTAHHSHHTEQGQVPSLSSDLSMLWDQRVEIADCSLP